MKYSILTIGDEICIGQIINGNAAEIASVMTSIGYSSYMYSIVPDDRELITDEIKSLLLKSDVLIMTGGLGPTHDDITKSVLCDFFEDDLVLHQGTLQHLQKWFKSRNRNMSEMNKA
ncbi:MAG: molybdopterin-binding protein, partial [Candidatus Kapaibacterium sp.]